MDKLLDYTLTFLVKKSHGKITEICLALKKRGFGLGRWNGVGGKVESGETIKAAAQREAKEEINVILKDFNKVAELTFYFVHRPEWNQLVHVYLAEDWDNEPRESEEMNPKWFNVKQLPYAEMWPDDVFWLPGVLRSSLIKATFTFGENDVILQKDVRAVNQL
jgi:8-oxo-dGTP pyrophosphatase MutT (NUDIX family)